jgi:hypothetical protein
LKEEAAIVEDLVEIMEVEEEEEILDIILLKVSGELLNQEDSKEKPGVKKKRKVNKIDWVMKILIVSLYFDLRN